MTLTVNPRRARVMIHTKTEVQRSVGTKDSEQTDEKNGGQTDGRTDGRYRLHYLVG